MRRRSRTTWRRWLAFAAALGVVFASDARLSGFASHPEPTTLRKPSQARTCCSGSSACCSAEVVETAGAVDACGCCRPVEPGDRPVSDPRSTLGLSKVKVDLGASGAPVALINDAPRGVATPDLPSSRPGPGQALYRLTSRFRC